MFISHIQIMVRFFEDYQINLLVFQKTDLESLSFISEHLANTRIIDLNETADWQIYFKQAQYCLGMRFHALLLAIKFGIPALGIAYDPKVSALCEAANLPFIKPNDLNMQNLQNLPKAFEGRPPELINFAKTQAH